MIVTKEEDQLTKLWALSALMGPFYAYQRAAVEWAIANGVAVGLGRTAALRHCSPAALYQIR